MEGVIAIVMVFSIPLAAILSSFYYKLQKLKLDSTKGSAVDEEVKRQIGNLTMENEELRERLKYIEQIVLKDGREEIDIELSEEMMREEMRKNKHDDF